MVSIIIPAYKEPYLNNTLNSILENSSGDIEVIPVIDGYILDKPLPQDSRIKPIILKDNVGMREAINTGIRASKGEFIMKLDAHCAVGKDFDSILSEGCKDNWMMVPRRYSLLVDSWDRNERKYIDYHYLNYPEQLSRYGLYMGPIAWHKRTDIDIDDTMTFQGSCWFANKEYFLNHVGFDKYPFSQEALDRCLKYWLNGGEVKVNKKTWYAHLNKRPHHYRSGMFSRRYKVNSTTKTETTEYTRRWFDKVTGLVEKFWPVPSWPEDRELWKLQ